MGNLFVGRPAEPPPPPPPFCDSPWRKFDETGSWTQDYRNKLVKSIKDHETRGGLTSGKIILLGLIKAGKSSFLNSVSSIDQGRMSGYSNAGDALKSMSLRLTCYIADKHLRNFRLYDVRGLELDGGIELEDIKKSIEGHIKTNFQYTPEETIAETSEHYNKVPLIADKVHCVALVLDAVPLSQQSLSILMQKTIKDVQEIIQKFDAPTVLILTKIDKVCDEVEKDVEVTFRSRKIYECVKRANEYFGVPVMNIFPVQNYTQEMGLNFKLDILILMALRHCVYLTDDNLKKLDSIDLQGSSFMKAPTEKQRE